MRLLSRAALTTGVILSLTLAPVPPGGATPLRTATDVPSGSAVADAETQRPAAGHRPRARRDVYRVTEDRRLRVRPRGVLRNDRDSRHRLRAKKVTDPREGRARVSRRGGLVYTPAADFVGSDSFTYRAVDRTRRSDRARVVLRVRPVNDAPSFTSGADQAVPPLAVPTTVTGWAGSISPGPADESGQDVTFLVDVVQGSALFSDAPRVDPDGTLHFTPSPLTSGTAVLDVVARDDGGTRRGGVDRSAPQRFEVTVLAPEQVVVLPELTTLLEGAETLIGVVTSGLPGELTYRFDCDGDGTFESGDLTDPEHTCLFPDDGTFSPEVEVVDGLGQVHSAVTEVVVQNVAPVLTLPEGGSVTEQLEALLDLGSFTDPGTDGPWDVLVEWGDGTTDAFTSATGSLGSLAHTWDLDDPDLEYVVTVTVTEAGGTASDTGTFVVDLLPVNDPPVAGACPLLVPLLQSTPVESSLLACASDPEGDPLTITSVTGPLGLGVTEVDGVWTVLPTLLGLLSLDWTVSDGALSDDGTAAVTVS